MNDENTSNFYITFGKREIVPFIAPGVQGSFSCQTLGTGSIFTNQYPENPIETINSLELPFFNQEISSFFSSPSGFLLSGSKSGIAYLFKLNKNFEQSDEFPIVVADNILDVIPTSDDGYAILGQKNNNLILIKSDSSGRIN